MNRHPLRAISEEDIQAYQRDGAVCLRQVFDRDWIDMLEPIARRMIAGEEFGFLPHRRQTFLSHCIDEFRQLAFESPLGEACGRTMQSKEIRFFFDQIFTKEPHSTTATPWHTDRAGWAVTGQMVPSFWMPLTPVSKINCLEVMAGTHTRDVMYWNNTANARQMVKPDDRMTIPDGEAVRGNPNYNILSWDMEPGDALLVHPWVLHYSAGNPTDDWRIAVSARVLGDDIRWDPRPECVNIAGMSFDEMMAGEKPSGPLVPLIYSEDGAPLEGDQFPRGFGTTWSEGARERMAKKAKLMTQQQLAAKYGGMSQLPAE